jgi:hypothetical protein
LLYLLDANTLIHAKNLYYPFQRVPEFWEWLIHKGEEGAIKVPPEIHDEISDKGTPRERRDDLALWSESPEFLEHLLLDEEVDQVQVAQITYGGYTPTPTEDDLEKMGNDPFLLAHANLDPEHRVVVTTEVSKPKRQGANRHIPDVAKTFGIRCINTFQMIHELDFSTGWKG